MPTAYDAVPPDTKDWTWVLDRPCDQCGFDAQAVGRAEVAPRVQANAAAWSAQPLTPVRPAATTWSPLEYACHVRDVLRLYDARLALMLSDVEHHLWDVTGVQAHA